LILIVNFCALAAREAPIEIKTGDRIHHPRYGLGRVVDIAPRRFGTAQSATFTSVFFRRDALTVMLRRRDLPAVIRPPLDARGARRVLDHLQHCEPRRYRKWQARAKANEARLQRGAPRDYAQVLRELAELSGEGQLTLADRQHLEQARELLAEEIGHALQVPADEALALVDERCTEAVGPRQA
jgi:RNA polymerase-interacting CarD/CdnL/TRCF family regulator